MRKYRKDPEDLKTARSDKSAVADVPKVRPCLRCGVDFESSGFGERICRRCKTSTTWRNGSMGPAINR